MRSAVALVLALLMGSGCAASQGRATAVYVEATKTVVDVALHTYVALAEQRLALCEQYRDAAEFAACVGVLHVPQVVATAKLIEQAQETFLSAYNANDLAGAAIAVADLAQLVHHFKDLIKDVRSSRRP